MPIYPTRGAIFTEARRHASHMQTHVGTLEELQVVEGTRKLRGMHYGNIIGIACYSGIQTLEVDNIIDVHICHLAHGQCVPFCRPELAIGVLKRTISASTHVHDHT